MPIQDFALLDLLFSGRGVVLDSARAEKKRDEENWSQMKRVNGLEHVMSFEPEKSILVQYPDQADHQKQTILANSDETLCAGMPVFKKKWIKTSKKT
ncbi:hypothetical protein TURU_113138 [Turdus rufiventris]|nr:hypothetical protein TURU_113138 [Turdus rufiventris]